MKKKDKLPIKITPCPIIDSIIEIRFTSLLPREAVFGALYPLIKNNFVEKYIRLPILQLPDAVRVSDPNLKFQPHFQFRKDNFFFQLGPNSISFSNKGEYAGWEKWYAFINKILNLIEKANLIDNTIRIGLRYINFFEENIFNNLNISINICDDDIFLNPTSFRTVTKENEFSNTIQLSNQVISKVKNKKTKGATIDIDCGFENANNDFKFFDSYGEIFEKAHSIEKNIFFNLLKDDFLQSLKPEYNEDNNGK